MRIKYFFVLIFVWNAFEANGSSRLFLTAMRAVQHRDIPRALTYISRMTVPQQKAELIAAIIKQAPDDLPVEHVLGVFSKLSVEHRQIGEQMIVGQAPQMLNSFCLMPLSQQRIITQAIKNHSDIVNRTHYWDMMAKTRFSSSKKFISLGCDSYYGHFAVFLNVLAALKFFERGYFAGIEIDLGTGGPHYDPAHGLNWWSYYYEPICYGDKINVHTVNNTAPVPPLGREVTLCLEIEHNTTRQEAFGLIQRHIRIKPDIQQEINEFEQQYFKNCYVIGVHYRGTDKIKEKPRVSYERVAQAVKACLQQHKAESCKIFIASDEQQFIAYMHRLFGDKIVYNKGAIRANDNIAIHFNPANDHYKCGRDALVDAVLLSRTNFLVKTVSCLSLCSTFFNPHVPVLLLS